MTATTRHYLHYTTTTTPLCYNYDYSCSSPHYIQQLWVRWPLQPLQPLQQTQIQRPFGQSVDSLWFTTTNLSYRFPILKLPPPPSAALLVWYWWLSWWVHGHMYTYIRYIYIHADPLCIHLAWLGSVTKPFLLRSPIKLSLQWSTCASGWIPTVPLLFIEGNGLEDPLESYVGQVWNGQKSP